MNTWATPDSWTALRTHTPARIALGACGPSLPTAEVLRLGLAHAQARDAVHQPLQVAALHAALSALALPVLQVRSAAPDRAHYLLRPDWGRSLHADSAAALQAVDAAPCDVVFVVGDGLSATAVERYAAALLQSLVPVLQAQGVHVGPVVLAQQARVALGDPVGQWLRARLVVMLIGERPGLSASDSMGAYLTWNPQPGTADAARNCVSNIRDGGLTLLQAAAKLHWLVAQALSLQLTGVNLKDASTDAALGHDQLVPALASEGTASGG